MIRKVSIAKAALALEEGEVIERGISDSPNMVLEQAKRETINIDKEVGWKRATLGGSEEEYVQPHCYDSPQNKVHILSGSPVKAPGPKGRKTLGGTDESSSDRSCSLASQDCDRGNDSNKFSEGVGGSLEPVNGDDDCVEPGGKRLINSVIVDQSKSCKRNEESPEWGNAEKEVDGSGGRPTGIGNCNKELRSSNEPKSLDKLEVIFASCPGSGGFRS
jgi:hypothetical protein